MQVWAGRHAQASPPNTGCALLLCQGSPCQCPCPVVQERKTQKDRNRAKRRREEEVELEERRRLKAQRRELDRLKQVGLGTAQGMRCAWQGDWGGCML